MSQPDFESKLPPQLRWRPGPINWDPVPEWWIREHPEIQTELISHQLETQAALLKTQLEAVTRAAEIIRGVPGKQ
jgi:hypothetical protein